MQSIIFYMLRCLYLDTMRWTDPFIHSFIHYMNLYSTSSMLLLRSAPDSSTAKKSSFKARVECIRDCSLGSNRSANGSPFETEGPTIKKARAWRGQRVPADVCCNDRCMMNIGKHHSSLVLSMAPDLLSTHPFFESIEPDINDAACILHNYLSKLNTECIIKWLDIFPYD